MAAHLVIDADQGEVHPSARGAVAVNHVDDAPDLTDVRNVRAPTDRARAMRSGPDVEVGAVGEDVVESAPSDVGRSEKRARLDGRLVVGVRGCQDPR